MSRLSAHSIAFLSITIKFSILIRQLRGHRQSIVCPPPMLIASPWMAFPAKVWCNSPYLAAWPLGARGDAEGSQLGDGNVWKPQPGGTGSVRFSEASSISPAVPSQQNGDNSSSSYIRGDLGGQLGKGQWTGYYFPLLSSSITLLINIACTDPWSA